MLFNFLFYIHEIIHRNNNLPGNPSQIQLGRINMKQYFISG
jgi:hypothetical protein